MKFENAVGDPEQLKNYLEQARRVAIAEGHTPAEADEMVANVARELEEATIFKNDEYTVHAWIKLAGDWPAHVHLSIRRNDRAPMHDWREIQAIKNSIVGPEHEGVELYPAESRKVDSANQYHLFVLLKPGLRFPIGFEERAVNETPIGKSQQRPLLTDKEQRLRQLLECVAQQAWPHLNAETVAELAAVGIPDPRY